MTDEPASQEPTNNDDWLSNPAPPPKGIGEPAHQPAPKAPPAPKRPRGNVTPLRPLDALGAALDDAPEVAQGTMPDPPPPPPEALGPAEPGGPPSQGRPRGEIWAGCPVRPLGKNGTTCFYLDVHNQLIAVTKHDAQAIMGLFGNQIAKLCYHFPQWNPGSDAKAPTRKLNRFDQTTAAMTMLSACSDKGIFDPENAVRGVGAWSDDDGILVYHQGDKVLIGGEVAPPGMHQGLIYPARPPVPSPAEPSKAPADPFPALYEKLSTWQWARPDVDAMIFMGMIGVQMFGGALAWRPAYWATGGKASGKSSLQELLGLLHGGDKGLVQSTDSTARGIAAMLGQSTLPVALDELEPDDQGSQKEKQIIATARVASSGGRWVRGSSDQHGATGQLRSTFMFSSILVPGILQSQDLSRIIVLSLNQFPEGTPQPPRLVPDVWRKRGAQIKRQIIDRWPTWAQRMALWREALAEHGIHGRDGDNWATTIAMAQMMQAEALPTAEELTGWSKRLAACVKAGAGEVSSDADEVLTHMLSQYFDPFRRGTQWTIAQWLMVAACAPQAPEALVNACSTGTSDVGLLSEVAARTANAHLAPIMLRVVREKDQEPRLFVGNKKVQPLLNLFRDTKWSGGVWSQSLSRVKGAEATASSRTLAGIGSRGWEIPLSSIPGLAVFPQDRAASEPSQAVVDLGDTY